MDEDLAAIYAIGEGDETSFLDLTRKYREPVFRLAYRYVGNHSDAAWLVEEAFTKVYLNAAKFKPRSSVKSWLYTIVANGCRDFLRREKRYRSMSSLADEPGESENRRPSVAVSDGIPNPAESAVENERFDAMQAAIQSLPEKLQFPFIFCVLESHSHDDAAEVLSTSRKTVESRIYRARKLLQAMLVKTELF